MGIGSSTLQTSYSGYPGEGRVGKFALSPDLQKETVILSKLFDKLLEKNNLLDFAKVLEKRGECGKLQVVLANQINKEFQTLRFPDPSNPSSLLLTSFIDEDQYKTLQGSEMLKLVCSRISEFLIRFVILIAALTFSIALPTGLPTVSDSSAQDIYRPSKTVEAKYPIPEDIWALIRTKTNAKQIGDDLILINGEYFMNRGGYMYANKPKSAVIDIQFEYFRYDLDVPRGRFDKTSPEMALLVEQEQIEKIKRNFGYTEEQARKEFQMQRNPSLRQQPYGYGGPGTAPGFGFSAPQPGRGGKRKTRSKQRKFRGGLGDQTENNTRLRLEITGPLPSPSPLGANTTATTVSPNTSAGIPTTIPIIKRPFYKIIYQWSSNSKEYVFDSEDLNAFEKGAFDNTIDKQTLQPQVIDGRRMNLLWTIDRVFEQTVGKDYEQDMVRQRFTGSKSFELLSFSSYLSEAARDKDFYSPAAYRAYLLASNIPLQNPRAIESLFCRDTWALTSLNSKPAYATLEGLYGFDMTTTIEGDENAFTKKSEFMNRMVGLKLAEQKAVDKSKKTVWTFDALQFPDNKDPRERGKIAGICATSRSAGVLVENKENIAILMDGYNKLKQLYQQHVKQVYAFLKTILVVDSTFEQLIMLPSSSPTNKPVIRLNESFVKYSTGSHMALNERIQFARDMLSEHYFQVEKIYKETLDQYNASL